jgi:glucuronosyltransferase
MSKIATHHLIMITIYLCSFSFNFPSDRYRSYDESLSNVSLALVNSHYGFGAPPRPFLPNLIEVGGLQVKPKASPLPEVK